MAENESKGYIETFGLIPENIDKVLDYDYEMVCGAGATDITFPEEYEIPRDGVVKNQGSIGACAACAIAAIAEAHWMSELDDKNEEVSEGFVYGALRRDSSKSPGMTLSDAMDFWKSIGTIPKKYFDFLVEMPEIKNMIKQMPDLYDIAQKYKLSGYVKINYAESNKRDKAIKEALMNYPYGLLTSSYNYFREPHAIVLTGWNDKTGKYKFKNSWGTSYGDEGYGEIPKDKIQAAYLPLFESIDLPFTDVSKDAWYYDAIKHIYFAGLMKGTSATTFEPDRPITRAEFAVMEYRNLKAQDKRFKILEQLTEIKDKYPHGNQSDINLD